MAQEGSESHGKHLAEKGVTLVAFGLEGRTRKKRKRGPALRRMGSEDKAQERPNYAGQRERAGNGLERSREGEKEEDRLTRLLPSQFTNHASLQALALVTISQSISMRRVLLSPFLRGN